MGAVQGFSAVENGRAVRRNGGHALGVDLEGSGWCETVKAQLVAKGDQAPDLRNDVRFADRVA